MRIWQAILASVAIHAALLSILLNMPLGFRSIRQSDFVEVRIVIDSGPEAVPGILSLAQAAPQAGAQGPPPGEPTEIAKLPAIPVILERPRKKAAAGPKIAPKSVPTPLLREEPVQSIENPPPAYMNLPLPSPPGEVFAATDQDGGVEASVDGDGVKQNAALSSTHGGGGGIGGASFTHGGGGGIGGVTFGGAGGPGFISRVLPRFPRMAREMGREGTVMLSLTIDNHGILQDVEVVEGCGFGFDEEALRAVRASKFRPAVRNGKPIASRALLPVRFLLRGSGDD